MNMHEAPQRMDLCLDWKFQLGEEAKAWYKGFDDSSWRTVDLPHDWAVEHPFSTSHSSGTGYLPGGTGYYRRSFLLPEAYRGKRIYITFDGVYNNSMVWCNSYYLGKRPYGYTEFIYDITDFACFGETPNVLTVKVEHKNVADSRWYTGSGIYRKVTVTVKDNISIPINGIFISVRNACAQNAELSVETAINNHSSANEHIVIRHTLYGAGKPVASTEEKVNLESNGQVKINQTIQVPNPKLWSTESPFLYTCVTEIIKEGIAVDSEKTVTGIRTFRFDSEKGFFLNGKSLKLKGVCVHHDAGCLGAAVRRKVWHRRLLALKEAGCNAIRMSHNPHMPELYDLCDELGFLVIDEAFDEWEGVKNKWTQGHNVYPPAHFGYYEEFPQWHEADLTAMVMRDRNHPSVILWSIGNEIDYPNDPYCHPAFDEVTGNNDKNKPAAERIYDPNRPNAERLVTIAKKLVSIVKRIDTTRPVTAALAFPELSNLTGLADCLDVVGYNYKEHLYEEDHLKYPEKIILGSENNKGYKEWLYVENHEYISGQFLWTGIDFLGETQIWPCHGSQAGILNIAGFKKPSFHFRKSLWSDAPVVKLFTAKPLGKSEYYLYYPDVRPVWNYDTGEQVQAIVFTNGEETELFMNGRSLGIKRVREQREGYLLWTVSYEPGELKAISTDKNGIRYASVLKTVGKAAEIRLIPLEGSIASDGRDMTHVIAEITDSEGNIIYGAEDELHVTVEGEGVLLGLESGNLSDTTPYSNSFRKVYNGRLLIYIGSGRQEGFIKVTATADRLKSAEVTIRSILP